jgi:D-2-hydroxyacid dehydrogenase (NADP+)
LRHDTIIGEKGSAMSKEPINIILSFRAGLMQMSEEEIRRIKAVSSRIRVTDVIPPLEAERKGEPGAKERLDTILSLANVYFGFEQPQDLITRAPKLKWIQYPLAGTDRILTPELIASPIILTKARIHERQISETVFTFVLMLARHSVIHLDAQRQHKTQLVMPVVLHHKTLGILGLGNIGQAVARIAKSFGMKVIATKAHPEAKYPNVDKVLPSSGLEEVLTESDFVIILLPLTEETRNMIGERELKLMKPTAFLINVSRGGIVDENSLMQALNEKRLAGAGLDAFATEPLPPDSKLWDTPNIIITPHNAGQRPDYIELLNKQFCQNLKQFIAGRNLIGVVDKKSKY